MTLHDFLPSRALLAISLALIAGLLAPVVLFADIQEVGVAPPQPTSCDSVLFVVSGFLGAGCWHYDGYDVEILPIMRPAGPFGTVFRIRVFCHRDSAQACPDVIVPYDISHLAGPLPPGPCLLLVDEVDSGQPEIIYDHKEFSFTVQQCGPPVGCVLPGFAPQTGGCNAIVSPGTTGYLYLTLANPMPVAGAEMMIDGFLQFRDIACAPDVRCGYNLKVTGVEPLGRAGDMGLEWTFSEGRLHLMFHPLSNIGNGGMGIIEPGEGPVARIWIEMAVDSVIILESSQVLPELDFTITLVPVAFADENANPIPVCPTFAPITGTICVRSAQKCDVNGDGRADVVDIVRMINCIMCPIPEGCCTPEETARGDCNGDGVINVTDVICCIRQILGSECGWCSSEGAPPEGSERPSVGLPPAPEWESENSFSVPINVSSASTFGGIEMRLAYDPAVLSVEGVRTGQDSRNGEVYFSASNGQLSIMVVALGDEPLPSCAGALAEVSFRLLDGASAERTEVSLLGVTGASASGTRLDFAATSSKLEIRTPSFPALASRPNPFLGSAEISLRLDSAQTGSLRVYDARGRLVSRIFDGPLSVGTHSFGWNGLDARGREVPSGVYFLRFDGGTKALSKKVVLLRR
jgi:hypothetical protein